MHGKRAVPGLLAVVAAVGLAACAESPVAPDATPDAVVAKGPTEETGAVKAQGRGDGPVIYVTSQDLFYDSIVTADPLPFHGKFQLLEMGPKGLQTEWGPGDQQYRGGRWWMDANGNGTMDRGDHYFSCPLLGPGRSDP